MDGLSWKTQLKWMIGGYHHFRKPPYQDIPPDYGWGMDTKFKRNVQPSRWKILTDFHDRNSYSKMNNYAPNKKYQPEKTCNFISIFQNILCIQWKLWLKKLDMNIICPTWENMQSSWKMGWSSGGTTIWQLCFSVSTVNFLNYFELPRIKSIRSEQSKPLCNTLAALQQNNVQKKCTESISTFFSWLSPQKLTFNHDFDPHGSHPSKNKPANCSTSWLFFPKKEWWSGWKRGIYPTPPPASPGAPHFLWRFHLLFWTFLAGVQGTTTTTCRSCYFPYGRG